MRYLAVFLLLCSPAFAQRTYDIVALKTPAPTTKFPEVVRPITVTPGTDLVLVHPDGSEEVLVAGGVGACLDPSVSLDGKSVYFAKFHDVSTYATGINTQRNASFQGCDIWRIDLPTRQQTQLTHGEWAPNTSWPWSSDPLNSQKQTGVFTLGYGIHNLCPQEIPGGRIVFCSSRNGYLPPKSYSFPNLQLFVMDLDGKNVEQIGHLNIGSALHPVLLDTGELLWSSWESQGLREQRLWGLWRIWPDGRNWSPQVGAFLHATSFHFAAQSTSGRVFTTAYYNANDAGFGTLFSFDLDAPAGQPPFGSLFPAKNTTFQFIGSSVPVNWPFAPPGLAAPTKWCHFLDQNSMKRPDGSYYGKVSHPATAPNGDILLSYSSGATGGTGPLVLSNQQVSSQIAILPGGAETTDSTQLQIVKADPAANYLMPKAVLSYQALHGKSPVELSWLPNDGSADPLLPKGTPYGIVGTSSLYKRDSLPAAGLTAKEPATSDSWNWHLQGSDAGVYDNSEIAAIRIVQEEPRPHLSYGPGALDGSNAVQNWKSPISERLRILGEIPVRKPDANGVEPLDPDGNPDTSFAVRIPADTPFTFQMLDHNGMTLTMAQTWHQVRPGEKRVDCGGCHAHSQLPTEFEKTAAAKPDYKIQTLDSVRDVEFLRDVKPILDKHCTACHNATNQSGYDLSQADQYTPTLARTQPLSARQSKLVAKIYGRWMDGSGTALVGSIMPPSTTGDSLTEDEKRTIATWIDLGCESGDGIFHDDLRPTLTVQSPGRKQGGPVTEIRFGALDCNSGLDLSNLSVKCSQTVNGQSAGSELASLFSTDGSVWTLALDAATQTALNAGDLTVSVKDKSGNSQSVVRSFSVAAPTQPTIEQLHQQIADLQEQLTTIKAQMADYQNRFNAIKAELP